MVPLVYLISEPKINWRRFPSEYIKNLDSRRIDPDSEKGYFEFFKLAFPASQGLMHLFFGFWIECDNIFEKVNNGLSMPLTVAGTNDRALLTGHLDQWLEFVYLESNSQDWETRYIANRIQEQLPKNIFHNYIKNDHGDETWTLSL